jgi:hypothetical protein
MATYNAETTRFAETLRPTSSDHYADAGDQASGEIAMAAVAYAVMAVAMYRAYPVLVIIVLRGKAWLYLFGAVATIQALVGWNAHSARAAGDLIWTVVTAQLGVTSSWQPAHEIVRSRLLCMILMTYRCLFGGRISFGYGLVACSCGLVLRYIQGQIRVARGMLVASEVPGPSGYMDRLVCSLLARVHPIALGVTYVALFMFRVRMTPRSVPLGDYVCVMSIVAAWIVITNGVVARYLSRSSTATARAVATLSLAPASALLPSAPTSEHNGTIVAVPRAGSPRVNILPANGDSIPLSGNVIQTQPTVREPRSRPSWM